MKHGIRDIAENLCTRQLGYRTSRDTQEAERREIGEKRFTSLDRAILRWADSSPREPNLPNFRVVKNPGQRGLIESAGRHSNHVIARLAVLQRMGLAESAGGNNWLVRQDFEEVLRAMQRAADRQKTLAAHGVPISDDRLPTDVLDIQRFTSVEGRILVHGQDEQSGQNYLMLEGTDARIHFVQYTPEMELLRAAGGLRANSFLRLRRTVASGQPMLHVQDLGDSEKVLKNRAILGESARALMKSGITPTEGGWGGWVGRYHATLATVVNEIKQNYERREAKLPERRRDLSRGR